RGVVAVGRGSGEGRLGRYSPVHVIGVVESRVDWTIYIGRGAASAVDDRMNGPVRVIGVDRVGPVAEVLLRQSPGPVINVGGDQGVVLVRDRRKPASGVVGIVGRESALINRLRPPPIGIVADPQELPVRISDPDQTVGTVVVQRRRAVRVGGR